MFEGSEGPFRAAAGRHEQRQPVKCRAHFFHCFRSILHRGADVAATQRWRPALRVGGNRLIIGHIVQRTTRSAYVRDLRTLQAEVAELKADVAELKRASGE